MCFIWNRLPASILSFACIASSIALTQDVPDALVERPPPPVFFEDAFLASVGTTVHTLLGAEGGRLVSTDASKENWLGGAGFAFKAIDHSKLVSSLSQSVRIYVHAVPRCAGEELLDHYMAQDSGYGWMRAMQLHAIHTATIHWAILNSSFIVSNPNDATLFYIPAFFGLLVERWLDTKNPGALNCMAMTWQNLPEKLFWQNAGYDHFMVAGTCHPFSVCGSMECDVTIYHPFASNVMVLTGGIRDFGHPDRIFKPAAVYPMLQYIFVPFPVTLNCSMLASSLENNRPIMVSFFGSENSRIRHMFRNVVEDPAWVFYNDSRLFLKILPDDQESARQAVLGEGADLWHGHYKSAGELYDSSQFCLLLPGHIYDFGRRAFDFMARGCVPVVVTLTPLFISVPFAGQVPWGDFAFFFQVASESEVSLLLQSLVLIAESVEGRSQIARRRQLLLENAPRFYLPPHADCPVSSPSAVDSIAYELGLRQAAWASLRHMVPAVGLAGQISDVLNMISER